VDAYDGFKRRSEPAPDLHTQLEELLAAVWGAEANWRFDDLLDVAVEGHRIEEQ
jgi:hypothetical protein